MKAALTLLGLCFAIAAEAKSLPVCRAELSDDLNNSISQIEWQQELYMGVIQGAPVPVLISASVGDQNMMSIWVREKTADPNGVFSFMDLSSGREMSMRFYMANRYSVEIRCQQKKR